jgi:hypothetical protein
MPEPQSGAGPQHKRTWREEGLNRADKGEPDRIGHKLGRAVLERGGKLERGRAPGRGRRVGAVPRREARVRDRLRVRVAPKGLRRPDLLDLVKVGEPLLPRGRGLGPAGQEDDAHLDAGAAVLAVESEHFHAHGGGCERLDRGREEGVGQVLEVCDWSVFSEWFVG